jgi:hypothetical protein
MKKRSATLNRKWLTSQNHCARANLLQAQQVVAMNSCSRLASLTPTPRHHQRNSPCSTPQPHLHLHHYPKSARSHTSHLFPCLHLFLLSTSSVRKPVPHILIPTPPTWGFSRMVRIRRGVGATLRHLGQSTGYLTLAPTSKSMVCSVSGWTDIASAVGEAWRVIVSVYRLDVSTTLTTAIMKEWPVRNLLRMHGSEAVVNAAIPRDHPPGSSLHPYLPSIPNHHSHRPLPR